MLYVALIDNQSVAINMLKNESNNVESLAGINQRESAFFLNMSALSITDSYTR